MPSETTLPRSARPDAAPRSTFRDDVLRGLGASSKRLPCKHFYDKRGSELFDLICRLPEYYPTRIELAIIERHADEIAQAIGPRVALVEYGSGSSTKTRRLLDALREPIAYVPVDISAEHLHATCDELALGYPSIDIVPLAADFTKPLPAPELPREPSHLAVYFPGSTIGNFEPDDARRLLSEIARFVGDGGGLVIGVDLQKDPATIEAAYNDSQGVTAEFNKNLLVRINDEFDADLDPDAFEHRAVYDAGRGCVDISLVSKHEQAVVLDHVPVEFDAGEAIHTEHSHKYTVDGFAEMAADAGFVLRRAWTDPKDWFAVLHLVVSDDDQPLPGRPR